jgi:hypothetical protein
LEEQDWREEQTHGFPNHIAERHLATMPFRDCEQLFPTTSQPWPHLVHKAHANIFYQSVDNPFAKRESHTAGSITTYKILTLATWLLSVVVSVYYVFNKPHDGFHIRRRIWDINYFYMTAFTMNSIIANIFWYAIFYVQVAPPHRTWSRPTQN